MPNVGLEPTTSRRLHRKINYNRLTNFWTNNLVFSKAEQIKAKTYLTFRHNVRNGILCNKMCTFLSAQQRKLPPAKAS